MNHLSHGKRGVQTWLPRKYKLLASASLKKIIGTYFSWLGFSLVLFLFLGVPLLLMMPQHVESSLSSFDTFVVDANVSTSGPIIISRQPLILVDVDKENATEEKVLFNNEGVQIKRSFWRGTRVIPWESITHIPEHAPEYSGWLMPLLLLLIPSLLLAVSLFAILAGLALLGISLLFGFIITKAIRFKISVIRLLKIMILALIPFTIILVVPLLYFQFFFIPVIVYVALVCVAIWFSGESKLEQRSSKQ